MQLTSKGGARPGSGRKPHKLKYLAEIEKFTHRAATDLGQCYDNLISLATGEAKVVEEEFVTVQEAKARLNGEPSKIDHLDAMDLVLVKRKIIHQVPDRGANEYIANRVLGKPATQTELLEEEAPEKEPLDLSLLTPRELNAFRLITSKLVYQRRSALSDRSGMLGGLHPGDGELSASQLAGEHPLSPPGDPD